MTRVTLPDVISGGGAGRGRHHCGLPVPPPGHHAVHLRRLGDRHQRGPVPQAVPEGGASHPPRCQLLHPRPLHQAIWWVVIVMYCVTEIYIPYDDL